MYTILISRFQRLHGVTPSIFGHSMGMWLWNIRSLHHEVNSRCQNRSPIFVPSCHFYVWIVNLSICHNRIELPCLCHIRLGLRYDISNIFLYKQIHLNNTIFRCILWWISLHTQNVYLRKGAVQKFCPNLGFRSMFSSYTDCYWSADDWSLANSLIY